MALLPQDSNGTSAWSPDLAVDTRTAPPPRISPCPPFYLQAHPARWAVLGGRVLPILARLPLQIGVAGVSESGGKLQARGAIAAREERGWTVIPHDVDGKGTSYLAKVDRVDAYVTRWESVFAGSDEIMCDTAGYYDWLAGLIAKGTIPACPRYALEKLAATTESALLKAQDLARTMPSALPKVERLAADLAVIRKEMTGTSPIKAGKKAAVVEVER